MQQDQLTVIFTREKYSFISWFIRFMLPHSRLILAESSHCVIEGDEYFYDTRPSTGVRRVKSLSDLPKNTIAVKQIRYDVPDRAAAIEFLERQVGKPYDLHGAFGVALPIERQWNEDDSWFCYELAAGALAAAGRKVFRDIHHITETALFALA